MHYCLGLLLAYHQYNWVLKVYSHIRLVSASSLFNSMIRNMLKIQTLCMTPAQSQYGTSYMQATTYRHPIVNRNVNSIFSCRGICSFHTTGRGRHRIRTSSVDDKAPIVTKNVVCPDIQCPLMCFAQKYWTGQH